jgi:predicted GTPase
MKADVSCEQRFIAEVDAFEFVEQDLKSTLQRLDDWLARLSGELQANRLANAGVSDTSALAGQVKAINVALSTALATWPRQWSEVQPALALADHFDDKAILLVFGKFNAGKSSFCNFLADRFAAQGKAVRYFHLDAGRLVETPERLREGVTESTARLQGVLLGERLILLDTPGLHSATPENAALTQRFTDSADGVLWLTSSASPGQVQELDELTRELHRAKPLLPVVTRSDLYEEDEIDGALVKFLRNKTAQNRALQEDDVAARASEKLAAMRVDVAQLVPPVSISVHMARAQGGIHTAMEQAGFERLYAALLTLAEPALEYKRRKPAEILLHHLEENVLGTLHDQVRPALAALKAALQFALDRLEIQREQVINTTWRRVVPVLPNLLDQHCAARDVKAVCSDLSQALASAFVDAEREHLADYMRVPDEAFANISLEATSGFDDVEIEADGQRDVVGVDYTRLYAELTDQSRNLLLRMADAAIERCRVSIGELRENAARMEDVLHARESALLGLKAKFRRERLQPAECSQTNDGARSGSPRMGRLP